MGSRAILDSPSILRKRTTIQLKENTYDGPFFLAVIESGKHRADVLENGDLDFNFVHEDGTVERTRYQLNNDTLYRIFAQATGQAYVAGETEKAMVKFYVRLHFQKADSEIMWLGE